MTPNFLVGGLTELIFYFCDRLKTDDFFLVVNSLADEEILLLPALSGVPPKSFSKILFWLG